MLHRYCFHFKGWRQLIICMTYVCFNVLCLKTRSRYQSRPRNPSVTGLLRWDWWRGDHPRDNLNQATPEILMKSTAGLSRELWVGSRFGWQSFSGFSFFSNPWVLINSINLLAIRVFYISQKEIIYLKRCLTLNFSFYCHPTSLWRLWFPDIQMSESYRSSVHATSPDLSLNEFIRENGRRVDRIP